MEEKPVYNIGEKLVFTKDTKQEKVFNKKIIVKQGTPVFVGADKTPLVHYLNGDIQLLKDNSEIKGYSATGIAEWIYEWLSRNFPIDEMLEEYDETKEKFIENISDSLEELGMYDHTGNSN